MAAAVLGVTGVGVVLAGVWALVAPLPDLVGVALPGTYRLALAGLGLLGGGAHLLAGWWAHERRDFFRTAFATGVGYALVQATLPVDLLALALLFLGREQFEG